MIEYVPQQLFHPPSVLECPHSSWEGMERVLADILYRFVPGCNIAVEFGVEYGYSAVALANYFRKVYAVDPLLQSREFAHETAHRLSKYPNIFLSQEGWQTWADKWESLKEFAGWSIDLIHIDIDPHDYPMTYSAGSWAAKHSKCVLFHDTKNVEHGTEVCRAIEDIAREQEMTFYCFTKDQGLGILVKE